MTTAGESTTTAAQLASSPFTRVVAGIDRTPEAVEAARQATVIAAPDAPLELVTAFVLAGPIVGGLGAEGPLYYDEGVQRRAAEDVVAVAAKALGRADATQTVSAGTPWDVLVETSEADGTLLCVGSHGIGRLRGIVLGSTATEVIHGAPSSVLVGRPAEGDFPRRIVVGVDGSPESAAAFAVARELAQRYGARPWPITAYGGGEVDKDAVRAIVGYSHEDLPDHPATALVAASAEADLLVVGSRGLRGVKALGSVSERVAHEARCSVLIVRNVAT
jgi:nucleotide-binding universal stress UspA family protein